MGDSATLLLGLLIVVAIPIVAVLAAVRRRRASSPEHSGAYFPDPWTAAPQRLNDAPPRSRDEDERGVPPGYYPDPSHVADRRYWDGAKWTKATQGKRR
jgi:hypothetical protein